MPENLRWRVSTAGDRIRRFRRRAGYPFRGIEVMNESVTTAPDMSLVKPAWIVLIVGWIIILLPIPLTGWLGWMIAGVGGAVLAIINLVRGIVGVGIAQLVCAIVGTWIIWWIGLMIFGASVIGALSTVN